ncbi:exportin-T isoform X2 [Parasteatoda tepidariorum]|nr:exportin-T isoform X2 [Parasteatoda tepidariorum]XP_015912212.2 exportin-T isoform X2 [Parasteatoda tepidariorum]XP_015912213.2 exportin-T isoform X2 [Parasteatoda tepidariorum]XP_042910555.1 exportin-T isoform X2 [Parasteatoda tepidariorum]
MNLEVIRGFLDQTNPAARIQAIQYFEQLKDSEDGWKLCINFLTSDNKQQDTVKFFCFQVISHYVKYKYSYAETGQQQIIREFLKHWIQLQCSSPQPDSGLILNKAAQIICIVFLADYPTRWPLFFDDILGMLNLGMTAIDIYLRILLDINSEIADREIPRTQKEMDAFTLIKDTMRETCVTKLVDSWHHILVTYQTLNPDLICLCLEVIGSYIAWIDINLIANERFVQLFITFLISTSLRESTCNCIIHIISKGMDPGAKVKLVESFVTVLKQAGVLEFTGSPDDEDFMVKLSSLVNVMGTAILNSWTRLQKAKDASGMAVAANAVHDKVELLLKFLSNDDDEVSQGVIEFTREYLQFLKNKVSAGVYGLHDSPNVESILYIVINKYKYDASMDMNYEGQEEAMFQEYRKSLKVIFDNLAMLDLNLVFTHTRNIITNTLNQWRSLSFQEIEVAITFLYLLGEVLPNCLGSSSPAFAEKKAEINKMLHLLITTDVSTQGHSIVVLQFFETVVRFEKFFAQESQHIPEILFAFLDNRGLKNKDPHVRSRVSYLFSRFIKCLKSQMSNYTEGILKELEELLVLDSPVNGIGSLSSDDQLYLYETAAILIVSANFSPETKLEALQRLLMPVAEKFATLLQSLPTTPDEHRRREIAKCMNHAIAVTSRTSKAFSNQQTMKSNGCIEVYLQALQVFLGALNLPYEQATLQSAVRQYLHRMVVCLECEVLPYFPLAAEQLLKTSDIRSIQEFIPLINQIICKFKKDVVPFVHQIFLPFVSAIFNALSLPIDENDQPAQNERHLLQRSYFLFIAAIVTNNISEVIVSQDTQNFERILLTVIQGAVDFPDPLAQKTCFGILKKMVELWGGSEASFVEFMYNHIVPACFMAPLKDTFDLNDAQTILALSESALCLKTVLDARGQEFVNYLETSYLPTLRLSHENIQQYCHALNSDPKAFKNYLKFFFQNAKT